MSIRKFRFVHDGHATWMFYYYGQFTGAVFKGYNDSVSKSGNSNHSYYIMMDHVFWRGVDDPAESGDILLQLPSLGESKKFLRENAAMSSIFKKKYGSNIHYDIIARYSYTDYRGV